jgi:hypothetical protein
MDILASFFELSFNPFKSFATFSNDNDIFNLHDLGVAFNSSSEMDSALRLSIL